MNWTEETDTVDKVIAGFVARWGSKTTFTVADQAVFSGTNFIVNILLARWLRPIDYGAFVITFSIFLILAGAQNSLVLEPLSVFGPRHSKRDLGKYFSDVLWLQITVSFAIAAVGVLIALMPTSGSLKKTIWALPLSAPLILQLWVARRAFYVQFNPKMALALSLGYCVLVFLGLSILRAFAWLSGFSAFLLLGVASLAVTWMSLQRIGIAEFRAFYGFRFAKRATIMQHWKYGKWALGEWITHALSTGIFPLLIGYFGGIYQAGEFRAMQNFIMPLNQTLTSLRMLLLPWASNRHGAEGDHRVGRIILSISSVFTGLALAYVLLVIPAGPWLINNLYSRREYLESVWLLHYLGAEAVLSALGASFVIALRASVRPDRVFWSKVVSAAITVTFGVSLGKLYGMQGLVAALVAGTLIRTGLLGWHSWSLFRQPKASNGTRQLTDGVG